MIVKRNVFCVFSTLPNQLISIIPKGYHNFQLFIVNCQFTKAPFAHKGAVSLRNHFVNLHRKKIKTVIANQ